VVLEVEEEVQRATRLGVRELLVRVLLAVLHLAVAVTLLVVEVEVMPLWVRLHLQLRVVMAVLAI
jgi:hypothetical protein